MELAARNGVPVPYADVEAAARAREHFGSLQVSAAMNGQLGCASGMCCLDAAAALSAAPALAAEARTDCRRVRADVHIAAAACGSSPNSASPLSPSAELSRSVLLRNQRAALCRRLLPPGRCLPRAAGGGRGEARRAVFRPAGAHRQVRRRRALPGNASQLARAALLLCCLAGARALPSPATLHAPRPALHRRACPLPPPGACHGQSSCLACCVRCSRRRRATASPPPSSCASFGTWGRRRPPRRCSRCSAGLQALGPAAAARRVDREVPAADARAQERCSTRQQPLHDPAALHAGPARAPAGAALPTAHPRGGAGLGGGRPPAAHF